ncbi:MAG: EipA family protein [Salaquimonas sp.]
MQNTQKTRFKAGLTSLLIQLAAFIALFSVLIAHSDRANAQASNHYTAQEIVDAGHNFFGKTSGALAAAFEKTFARYGLPNGYILGEEAGGAFIGGLRYGEGQIFTKNAGDHKVFWQGPSIGWDYGLDGNRTMMLVYNLADIPSLYKRYYGVSGSAYLIGGVGVTALTNQGVHLIPIKTGVGVRLGANIGYLKLTDRPRVNPF